MPHGHGVDNCSLRFHRKGGQFDLGESRSSTRFLSIVGVCVRIRSGADGDGDDGDGDGDGVGDGDGDGDGVAVGDSDHSTRST